MLSEAERLFLSRRRVGYLSTADFSGAPHLVPICFAAADAALYSAIDEKPKSGLILKRVKNILENPRVAFLADHYDENWSRLAWLRLDGHAELLAEGPERDDAIGLLRTRYAQYQAMQLSAVIAIRVLDVRSWGDLSQ
ncbi:MAG TPA: TIGR03668 family PPOX class F420-dependent oxidoreductase [Rhizomicrobium sp.]|jgi:PPOX class probable F420-dependent enzyme